METARTLCHRTQFEKMPSVMTQIETLTESLTQNNDESDDEIKIDCDKVMIMKLFMVIL